MRHCRVGFVVLLTVGCGASGRGLSPIRLEPIVTLGATSGDGAIATTPVVSAVHPGGFRVVIPASSAIGTLPLIFADDGHFVEALRGNGEQDGTFSGPIFSRFGPGDSIWVFDNSGRVLIFSPQRRYVRTANLERVPTDAMVLSGGRILSSPMHGAAATLTDVAGNLIRTIGDTTLGQPRIVRAVSEAGDGSFWLASTLGQWRIEHWDSNGTRRGVLELHADWLPPQGSPADAARPRADRAPEPTIVAAWIDASQHLWVVGAVADRHWQAGLAAGDPNQPGSATVIDSDRYFDTIVDERDLATGVLIATARFDIHCSSMAEPGVLVHAVRTSAGWQRAELLRVMLNESTSRP